MYQMTAEYIGGLRTAGKHIKSGNTVVTDAPVDNNGRGEAYSPTDLVCTALCSCMMTVMGIVAARENIVFEGITATIEKVMTAEPPRKIAEIHIVFTLPDPKQLSQKQAEILKRAAHTCPVALSLHPDIVQNVSFNF